MTCEAVHTPAAVQFAGPQRAFRRWQKMPMAGRRLAASGSEAERSRHSPALLSSEICGIEPNMSAITSLLRLIGYWQTEMIFPGRPNSGVAAGSPKTTQHGE